MKKNRRSFKEWLLDILFPRHIKCIFCGGELNENSDKETCENCADKLPYITNACPKCGNKMAEGEVGVCFECKTTNFEFEQAVAVFEYSGKVVKAVHDFKYQGNRPLYEPLGQYMCETLAGWDIEPDLITFVPMTKKKQKERGFNQSELLARYIAKDFNIPCAQVVEKIKETSVQASLNFHQRQENIKDCFEVKKDYRKLIKGLNILLIDDIFTTGATSNEVTRILNLCGAEKVYVLTLAHTSKEKEY